MKRNVSLLAIALHGFLTDYLPQQRAMSPHTLHSYRDSLKLLLQFVAGKKYDPSQLTMPQLTYEQILAFLQHLEASRHNQISTRNVRVRAPFTASFVMSAPITRSTWPKLSGF